MNTLIENYSIWEIIQSIKEGETKITDWKTILSLNNYQLLVDSFATKENKSPVWGVN